MIKLEVKDGKVSTEIKSDNSQYDIPNQILEGVSELFAEFQVELIRRGNSKEKVNAAFLEMISLLVWQNQQRVNMKLQESENSKIS